MGINIELQAQVTFLRMQMFSFPCAVIVMQPSAQGSPGLQGLEWLKQFVFYCFPARFKRKKKKPFCFVVFSPPVRTHYSARRNAVSRVANNGDKKTSTQKPKGPNPRKVPPLDSQCSFLPWSRPSPCPPAKSGMLQDSDLFTQGSHLAVLRKIRTGKRNWE